MQHLSKIKQLEKELYAYDEAYETLTKQRQGHQKVFEAYTGSAGATDHDGSGQKSFFPSKR
ncbi:hypothetical protein CPC08DRAFT_209822 [Agrocybe pediades]|nr:hypothetical protein CPC08DRAFT_209822 [Agrocybe pediades]